MKKLVLIPGATGKMGREYSDAFSKIDVFEVVGFTSNENKIDDSIIYCDFLDVKSITNAFDKIDFTKYTEVYIIHSIGPFLFEENGEISAEIDNRIFNLNYQTFVNGCEEIKKRIRKEQSLIICAFGSISDRLVIPLWKSYSTSKNKLREYIIENINANTRGVFIDVSSTEKEEERPFADKTYWLKCSEVVERTIDSILNPRLNFQELFVIKPHPNYDKDYFKDLDKLKKKWLKEMYGPN